MSNGNKQTVIMLPARCAYQVLGVGDEGRERCLGAIGLNGEATDEGGAGACVGVGIGVGASVCSPFRMGTALKSSDRLRGSPATSTIPFCHVSRPERHISTRSQSWSTDGKGSTMLMFEKVQNYR